MAGILLPNTPQNKIVGADGRSPISNPNANIFQGPRLVMLVRFKKYYDFVETPVCGSPGSAGNDIFAYPEISEDGADESRKEITIQPGEIYRFKSGFSTEFDWNTAALIMNRSSMAVNGLVLPAGVFLIDSDYRGEWQIPIKNTTDKPVAIHSGDRIAQVIWIQTPMIHFEEAKTLSNTERGNGGFGSTGR